MSTNQSRIDVFVDIFELEQQRAQVLPTITPAAFIASILEEFTEAAYLGDNPGGYQLYQATDQTPLDVEKPLGEQLQPNDHLILRETEAPLPDATQRPSKPLYLREPSTGKVYPIQWVPAIIGRRDASQPDNAQVAVDLGAFPTGMRVSRRHAVITEEQGHFYLESTSSNETALKRVNEDLQPVVNERVALAAGERIHLERSGIDLLVLMRDGAGQDRNVTSI